MNAKPRRSVESTAAPTRARLQTRDWAAAVLGAYDNRHRKRPWLGCYGRFASAFAQTCISYRRMVKTFQKKYLLLLKSIAQRSNADQSGLVCQTVHVSVLSCRQRIWMAVSSFLHCFIIPSARTISVPSPLSTEAPGAALSVPKAYFLEGITAGAIIRLSACVAFLSLDFRFIKALGIVSLCCAPRGGAP